MQKVKMKKCVLEVPLILCVGIIVILDYEQNKRKSRILYWNSLLTCYKYIREKLDGNDSRKNIFLHFVECCLRFMIYNADV